MAGGVGILELRSGNTSSTSGTRSVPRRYPSTHSISSARALTFLTDPPAALHENCARFDQNHCQPSSISPRFFDRLGSAAFPVPQRPLPWVEDATKNHGPVPAGLVDEPARLHTIFPDI